MKLYEKFLEDSFTLRQLLDTYLELRQHFQELGFSEDQLEKPPHYTRKMMNLFHKFDNDRNSLLNDVKSYGFDMNFNELSTYLTPLLEKINELTPLKNTTQNRKSWS